MKNLYSYLVIALVSVSVLLVTAILIQQRGAGVSDVFGGGGASYSVRRGAEKKLHVVTIALVVLFLAIAFGLIFVKK